MYAEFNYTRDPNNSRLQFYGGYPSEKLEKAIISAGWTEPEHKPPRLEGELPDYFATSFYVPTSGSGLFGGNTEEEFEEKYTRLTKAIYDLIFEDGEVEPPKFRQLTAQEQL